MDLFRNLNPYVPWDVFDISVVSIYNTSENNFGIKHKFGH